MKNILNLAIICLAMTFAGCNIEVKPGDDNQAQEPEKPQDTSEMTHTEYKESTKAFANPERGFYKHYDFMSSSASPLTASAVQAARVEGGITVS